MGFVKHPIGLGLLIVLANQQIPTLLLGILNKRYLLRCRTLLTLLRTYYYERKSLKSSRFCRMLWQHHSSRPNWMMHKTKPRSKMNIHTLLQLLNWPSSKSGGSFIHKYPHLSTSLVGKFEFLPQEVMHKTLFVLNLQPWFWRHLI